MRRTDKARQREKARILYFQNMAVAKIAEELGLSEETVNGYACDGKWSAEYERQSNALLEHFRTRTKRNIAKIWDVGIPLIQASLEYRMKIGTPLSLKDAKLVSEILTSFDKLKRFDIDQPLEDTSGTFNVVPLTIEQIRAAIDKDVFTHPIPRRIDERRKPHADVQDVDEGRVQPQGVGEND